MYSGLISYLGMKSLKNVSVSLICQSRPQRACREAPRAIFQESDSPRMLFELLCYKSEKEFLEDKKKSGKMRRGPNETAMKTILNAAETQEI